MDERPATTRRGRRLAGGGRRRRRNYWGILTGIGHGLAYVILCLTFLLMLGLGVASIVDQTAPVVWGTFTEEQCEPKARGGCSSVGHWVSDDGTLRLDDVRLDGWPDSNGIVRAGYRPEGILGGNQNVVHVSFLVDAGPFVTFGIAALMAYYLLKFGALWGYLRIGRRRRRDISGPDGGEDSGYRTRLDDPAQSDA